MAQHDVSFTVPERTVGNADIKFIVKRNGKVVGTLKVSKGSLVWLPKHAKKAGKRIELRWQEFGELVERNERQKTEAEKPPKASRKPRIPKPRAPEASGKRRFPAMFAEGIIKAGDVLHINGKENSEAAVIDGKGVRFGDKRMTINEWGKKVIGHKTVNIYVHAMTSDGKFLNELR